MSFFDNAPDLDSLPDDPFTLPENTYLCRIVEVNHGATKNNAEKYGLSIKYQIIEGDYSSFFPFTEWLHTPNGSDDPKDPQVIRSYANLKKHFMAYGFGVDELAGVTAETLKDREVYLKLKSVKKDDRNQVRVLDLFSTEVKGDGLSEFAQPSGENSGIDF